MYDNPQNSAVPPPRSESLAANFKGFMEADKELHDARENVASIRVALADGEQRLLSAEKRWREQVECFSQLMAMEAPTSNLPPTQSSYQEAPPQPLGMGVGGSLRQRW
jgi:hypothetical protein